MHRRVDFVARTPVEAYLEQEREVVETIEVQTEEDTRHLSETAVKALYCPRKRRGRSIARLELLPEIASVPQKMQTGGESLNASRAS
jgi:hypothetical protein